MAHLILTRHGESQFNAKSLWTGTWDVPLTHKGRGEAKQMAALIKDTPPKVAFTSLLSRAKDTLAIILDTNHWTHVPVHSDAALNERDYGELTGMNKWAVEERFGEKQFQRWRRGWDDPVPDGETLKQVYRRAVPYYDANILPELKHDHNVLVTAHGNTLRALIKHLDELDSNQVQQLEMPFGEVLIYTFDKHGKVLAKERRKLDIDRPPA
ncbi:MAG: 2,3-bisphosphoglycerate-dependent phosphoglycerate mutase (phosphoglyceromutase) (pgam) [Candidatus Saccharibacteria bacterium]|jgi:2,3-bisphosphoglycerate-dependent phosphoglycerate mutase|nr:2,3-bisphosphoglycerate-dependent phosphoglycerate mutase (phosphoglyceromutase) (pgam) [Candidatus Saccharibacteria bacterium]